MTRRISLVAICCSRPSASRFSASAKRFSRSRTRVPSAFADLRAAGGLASFDLAGFGPLAMSLPLSPNDSAGDRLGERGRVGKWRDSGVLVFYENVTP